MVDTGAGLLSLDNSIDLAEAKLEMATASLWWATSGRPNMLMGTPETVENNVKECVRKGHDSPRGYILALGCELPIKTPPANVHALSQAVRKYGRFPWQPELWNAQAELASA